MAEPAGDASPTFNIQHDAFTQILGADPNIELCLEDQDCPFAHEAGVYMPSTGDLFITSNQYPAPSTARFSPSGKTIHISKIGTKDGKYTCEKVDADVPMGNGGVNYKDGVLFCAQGTLDDAGGLVYMEASPPYKTENLASGFFSRQFNSINDVVVHKDGSIWFTDPIY